MVGPAEPARQPLFGVFAHVCRGEEGSGSLAGHSGAVEGKAAGSTVVDPMVVFKGPLGMGKSTLAVDVQNQWPLLPIIVAAVNEHDRRCP